MLRTLIRSVFERDARLLKGRNELQTLEVLPLEYKASEPTNKNDRQRDLHYNKRNQLQSVSSGTKSNKLEQVDEADDTDVHLLSNVTCDGNEQTSAQALAYNLPEPSQSQPGLVLLESASPPDELQGSMDHSQSSLHQQRSKRSLSSASDSKPDVVKCTRLKIKENDLKTTHRNSYGSAIDLTNTATELKSQEQHSRKRWHSFGDELDLDDTDVTVERIADSYEKSEDTRKASTQSGLWMTQLSTPSVDSNGIWTTEVLPPTSLDGWRLSLDHFTPKRQGSKRKAKHVSKRARSFYKCQDELIKSFETIRYEMEEDKTDMKVLRKKVSSYAKLTFFANLVLLVIKIIAVVMSGSVSLISSLVDSSVDLISGIVIWVMARLVKKTDPYLYPQGRTKLEPIAVVILSVIMAVASLHLVEETIEKTIQLAGGESEPPTMEWVTVGISCTTVVVKLVLYLICRKVPHQTIQALAQDHRNDVLSNSAAIIFGYIGSKEMQAQINNSTPELVYLDPVGAILICIYISISWCHTGWGQIKMLTGHTAKPDFLSKITWLTLDHHEKIQKVNSVRAFHFGNNFLVEVEILLPAAMTVTEACDISKPLEEKLEHLTEVERAFVHIDYDTGKQKRKQK